MKEHLLVISGFNDELVSLDLLSYHRTLKTCRRHITVEHTPAWWRVMHKAETQRLFRLGHDRYAAYFLDSVRRFHATAKKLYLAWLAQIKATVVAHVAGEHPGTVRFVPHTPIVRATIARHSFLPPVIGNRPAPFKPASVEIVVSRPDEGVPQVPAVQPLPQDLRDGAGRDLAESANGAG